MFYLIKPRRGTRAEVQRLNIILRSGEMFFELDSDAEDYSDEVLEKSSKVFRIKIGDGVTKYNDLPYVMQGNMDKPIDIKFYNLIDNPESPGRWLVV